jgi:Lon protease-like protein
MNMLLPNARSFREISNERLVTMLMMICPFDSKEKQALLETAAYTKQSELITFLMEMYAAGDLPTSSSCH